MLLSRLDKAAADVDVLSRPSYDTVYAYVDRQMASAQEEVERKLEKKADMQFVERAVPLRLEDLYRSMNGKLNDLKADMAQCATKEDFHALGGSKADGAELRTVAQEVADRVTRPELQQAVSTQVRPLVTAVAALEKVCTRAAVASLSPPQKTHPRHLHQPQCAARRLPAADSASELAGQNRWASASAVETSSAAGISPGELTPPPHQLAHPTLLVSPARSLSHQLPS